MIASMMNVPSSLFGDFERLQRELEQVFAPTAAPSSIRSVAPGTFPALNVGRTAQSVEIYAFAPGLDAAKVEVTVDRGVLTLAGERANDVADDKKQNVYGRERLAGRFKRAVSLPDDADPAQVQATYRDGVLRVSVALREATQPQRITVQ